MEIARAEEGDHDGMRDSAYNALQSSFALSPETIQALLDEQFSSERFAQKSDDDSYVLFVARDDDRAVGFAEGAVVQDGSVGEIRWLFVATEARGQGAGTELFERTRDALRERGVERVRATVLSDNMEGSQFFERFDMVRSEQSRLEIDGQPHAVDVYAEAEAVEDGAADAEPIEPEIEEIPETVETEEGEFRVDQEETRSGTKGPFLVAYTDEGDEDIAGFYCTACGTLVQTMDDLGRIECDTCGNVHRADEWDDSYL